MEPDDRKDEVQASLRDDATAPVKVRDLSDFCERWPQLRPSLETFVQDRDDLGDVGETIGWLIVMADKVCKIDKFDE
ncbi:MAG: hypothetical protein AAGD34_05105 [Pseudomonadota bacterium]